MWFLILIRIHYIFNFKYTFNIIKKKLGINKETKEEVALKMFMIDVVSHK